MSRQSSRHASLADAIERSKPKDSLESKAQDRAALQSFFERQPDGEYLAWDRLESETCVVMSHPGRELARTVLRQMKRAFETIHGEGIRLSSPETVPSILSRCRKDVGNKLRRWGKAHENCARHLSAMTEETKKAYLLDASFLGAIRSQHSDAQHALPAPKKQAPPPDPRVLVKK